MAKKKTQQADNLQELESALTKTEQFIEDNQNIITYVVGAIILVVAGYLGFSKFYLQPKENEAQAQMFMAESYFEKDSFNLSLNGDGNYLGFLDIIEDYGITKSANRAKYYTGIAFLQLGQFEDALDYLNDFKTNDLLLGPVSEGAKGDALLELGETDQALKQYQKAYSDTDNELTTPIYMMKAANLLESIDELEEALSLYEEIKEKYPDSDEGTNVERFIARVKIKLG
ncbi:MAG: tetratricopeptide repeat protein [Prolixibacteraceae bacterium]|jgi:tetratricopeptide (TPR) repeat protein|nr:tetratricopeptide repeat protein [Prolixibacteraceae bacterium]MBT7000954.1 tetratricopeptide repeat protein [Prolixibacteraceae bacterium]MBT7397301.1 tetratricopeptide repeat protein [Prolixibacteraceae bacterium]